MIKLQFTPKAEKTNDESMCSEGILLSAGTFYWFETMSDQLTAPLKIDATTGSSHPDARIIDIGQTKIRRGTDEACISSDTSYRDAEFYK